MVRDLTNKYRPRFFADFWRQEGSVEQIAALMRVQALPQSIILHGDYGTGKTGLARVTSRTMKCPNRKATRSCGRCKHCAHHEQDSTCYGQETWLFASKLDSDLVHDLLLRRVGFSPSSGGRGFIPEAGVVIIDEAQCLTEEIQMRFAHWVEDSSSLCFIFCTTHLDDLSDALRRRSHLFPMAVPTEDEAFAHLKSISLKENFDLDDGTLIEIVRENQCNPRNCIKALHMLHYTGSLKRSNDTHKTLLYG